VLASAITVLAGTVTGCGSDQVVGASEMPAALRAAIPRFEQAGYEVQPELVGPDDVPVLVLNPDTSSAARVSIRSGPSLLPLSIDGVPADETGVLHSTGCRNFSFEAPDDDAAHAALRDSGLCS